MKRRQELISSVTLLVIPMSKSKSKADEAEAAGTMSKAEEVIKKETGADLLRDATGDTVENREDKVYSAGPD